MRTPESELLERAEWYQEQYQKLLTALNDTEKRANVFKHALERIRDSEYVVYEKVRQIAREALE